MLGWMDFQCPQWFLCCFFAKQKLENFLASKVITAVLFYQVRKLIIGSEGCQENPNPTLPPESPRPLPWKTPARRENLQNFFIDHFCYI